MLESTGAVAPPAPTYRESDHVRRSPTREDIGYMRHRRVYLLECRTTGLVKIGMSNKPWSRARDIASICPTDVHVWCVLDFGEGVDGKQMERELHAQFASVRKRGEWFRVDPRRVARAARALADDLEAGL